MKLYANVISWRAPKKKSRGNPDFILAVDPDGWEGNYPVAFWDDRWQDIMIYGANSALNQVIADGFDGIYMDWVEDAYSLSLKQGYIPYVSLTPLSRLTGTPPPGY